MQIPAHIDEIKWLDVLVEYTEPNRVVVVFVLENELRAKDFINILLKNPFELFFSFPDKKTRGTGIHYLESGFSQEFVVASNMSMGNSFLIRSLKKSSTFFINSAYRIPDTDEPRRLDEAFRAPVEKVNVKITEGPVRG